MKALLALFFVVFACLNANAQLVQSYAGKSTIATVTILSGQTTSAAFYTGGMNVVAVAGPAAMTGTAISFIVSDALNGTYNPLYNSAGTAVSIASPALKHNSIASADGHGLRYVKLVSTTAEAADRVFKVYMRGL